MFFLLGLFAEAPDLKQEERLQELESCSGVGSTSDDTEVREVSSRPSTPGLSVVSGINLTKSLRLPPLPNICFVLLGFLSETIGSISALIMFSFCLPLVEKVDKNCLFLALLYSVCRAVMLLGGLLTSVMGSV